MRGPTTRVYPDIGDGRITLDGGLSSKFPRSLILDNESPDCLNVVFDEGGVETRQGSTLLNTTAVGSFSFDGLYTRISNAGVESMVAFANGTGYVLNTSTFVTIGSAQSVFTAGARVGAINYESYLFCGDGQAIPYKYNGTDWTRHGVYPATTTHTAATSSNGTLTGAYRYKVAFVNSSTVQSDVGPANATFTATAESILVSSIPVAPQSYGISSRYLYRTEAGGSTYRLLTTINDNTTTTYVDNISDSALGATAPTDQGVPPTYDVIEYHQDRLFVNDPATPNYLVYSELAEPFTFKATNFLRFGDNATDIVRAIVKTNNGILVAGNTSMMLVYMPSTDETTWVSIVLDVDYGCISPYAISSFNNRLILPLSRNNKFVGFGSVAGTTLKPETTFNTVQTAGSQFNSYKIQDQMDLVVDTYQGNISSVVFDEKVYFSVTYGEGQTTNNRIYVLNFQTDNLSKVQRFSWSPWSGLNIAQFTVYNNILYGASSQADGKVYKLIDGTYNDNGSAINSYFWTKEFAGPKTEINYHKDFRMIYFLIDKPGDYYMDMFIRVDSDKGGGDKFQINLDPGGSLWGTVMGGVDNWGGGVDQEDYKQFLSGQKGKRIQMKFTNQNAVDQKFRVNWLKYVYNLKGLR